MHIVELIISKYITLTNMQILGCSKVLLHFYFQKYMRFFTTDWKFLVIAK